MKFVLHIVAIILTIWIFLFISCKKGYLPPNVGVGNKPPIAIAGSDQITTLPTDSISLDGRSSSDPDGTISKWLWTKISGPAFFNIIRQSDSITKVKALVMGTYQFELKVTDNGGQSAKDTVQVIVNAAVPTNHPPVANAVSPVIIYLPTNTVYLNGINSYDPDHDIISYSWTKISGPSSFNITNSNAAQPQVTNLVEGVYQFELKVTDAGGLFSKDTTLLIVSAACDNSNSRPLVNAQLIPIGTLSQAGNGAVVASAGNKILFAGNGWISFGSSRVDIYDLVTQTWSTAELSVARWAIAAVAAGNKIFFAGGEHGDGAFDNHYPTVDIYDASTNTWSVASLSVPRSQIAAATIGNKVFFAGGEIDDATTADKVDIYDLSTNSWSTAQLSEPRSFISAVTVNSKIYFAGGYSVPPQPSSRVDIYDNITNSWTTSSLNEPKSVFAGVVAANKIYWAGGFNEYHSESCEVEIKDVNTGNSSISNLFKPGMFWIDGGNNAVVKDNTIVFLSSGWYNSNNNKFDIYNITTDTWSMGVLPVNISGASIISVNNTIYVAGGIVNGVLSNQVWKLEF